MKKIQLAGVFALVVFALSSCQLIEGVFKAGVWVGIILVVLVILLIVWLLGRSKS